MLTYVAAMVLGVVVGGSRSVTSGRLEVGGDLHDLVVGPAEARSLIGGSDRFAALAGGTRAQGADPLAIQRWKTATRSGGHAPSQGIVPSRRRSRIASWCAWTSL
jgi:hypothetical protein